MLLKNFWVYILVSFIILLIVQLTLSNKILESLKLSFGTSLNPLIEVNQIFANYNSEVFLQHYCLSFSFSIFFIGIAGIIFNRKNLINVMISIELMLLGACLNFIFFSVFLNSMVGQMFALFVIAIAAADSAIGLGILVAAFYLKRNISFENFSFLKG